MVDIQSVGLFISFWTGLYLMDILLRTSQRTQTCYSRLMDGNGLSISVGQVRWYTKRFNRTFMRAGQWSPALTRAWFTLGGLFGVVAQLASICLLSYVILQAVRPAERPMKSEEVEEPVLTPLMPGVNLPSSQLGYYLMTLLVCGILHEAGHAVAAVREQVRVEGFGVFFLALYPGAFVDLFTEHLQSLTPFSQLRIYCAGIWHNFIIVLVALCLLVFFPYIAFPFYSTGQGAQVTRVVEDSPVWGPRGLASGDLITGVDHCTVVDSSTWLHCVHRVYSRPQLGYCISRDHIRSYDTSVTHHHSSRGVIECCPNTTNSHICFKCFGRAVSKNFACLPARHVTASRSPCYLASHCSITQACVLPSVENTTRLVRVEHGRKEPLLFLGHSVDLLYSVYTSDYAPRVSLIPLSLPYVVQTFCKYLVSLSGALVVLNVVPCYALDGQWILRAFIELSLSKLCSKDTRLHIFTVILLFGTLLLMCNILVALYSLFR